MQRLRVVGTHRGAWACVDGKDEGWQLRISLVEDLRSGEQYYVSDYKIKNIVVPAYKNRRITLEQVTRRQAWNMARSHLAGVQRGAHVGESSEVT